MNDALHHKWNDARDSSRGSNKPGPTIPEEQKQVNKLTLKQNKPR